MSKEFVGMHHRAKHFIWHNSQLSLSDATCRGPHTREPLEIKSLIFFLSEAMEDFINWISQRRQLLRPESSFAAAHLLESHDASAAILRPGARRRGSQHGHKDLLRVTPTSAGKISAAAHFNILKRRVNLTPPPGGATSALCCWPPRLRHKPSVSAQLARAAGEKTRLPPGASLDDGFSLQITAEQQAAPARGAARRCERAD